ncbi:MAG: autotransporter-associated beta strand repeat-containing protein [Pirellulales bacterium]
MNLGVAGGAKLQFDLTTVPTTAPLSVTNPSGIAVAGTNIVSITSNNALTVGTYSLIKYNTSLAPNVLGGLSPALPPRVVATLVDNVANSTIDLNITGVDFIKWTGATSTAWNIDTTQNWKTASVGAATTYLQPTTVGDTVYFDDSAAGGAIALATEVRPVAVTFDNTTLNYTLTGAGAIAGPTGLVKNGTGTLTVATNNTNTGATAINAGTLTLGDGGALGSLGTGGITVAASGKLIFNRNDVTLLRNVFTGAGELVKEGTGTVALDSDSRTFTGKVTVNAGTFQLSNASAATHNFNATSIVVNNGGTFEFVGPAGDSNLPATTYVTVNQGGIVNWSEAESLGGLILNDGTLNLVAGFGLDGATNSTLNSGTINGTGGALSGAKGINKLTSGTVTITGAGLNNTGGLNIVAGTISTDSAIIDTGALTFGNTLATSDPDSTRGTLELRTTTSGTVAKAVTVNAGGGVIGVKEAAVTITSTGALTAAAGATLAKAGAGELQLNGAATYGDNAHLQVDAGKLTLNPTVAPTIGTGVTIGIASGATLTAGGTVDPFSAGGNSMAIANQSATGLNITAGVKTTAAITGTGTTSVTGTGTQLTAKSITQNALSIGAGAKVTIAADGTNAGVSRVKSLAIPGGATPTGTLDLKNNDLILDNVDYAAATATHASITQSVKYAYNGMAWDRGGLTSSTVTDDINVNGNFTALGIMLNNFGDGTPLVYGPDSAFGGPLQFDGQTVDANAVLVKYTYLGDANLDGLVNGDDFFMFQFGYSGAAPYTGWAFGDFDYNGTIDGDDFFLFQLGYSQGGPQMGFGESYDTFSARFSATAVPEPSAFAAGGALALGLGVAALRRRRRKA